MNRRPCILAKLFASAIFLFLLGCGQNVSAKNPTPEAEGTIISQDLSGTSIPLLVGMPSLSTYQSAQSGGLELTLMVTPGIAGDNDISLFFFDKNDAIDLFVGVQLSLKYLDFESGCTVVEAILAHSGHAFISGGHLRHAGRWRIDVLLRRSDSRETRASFEVRIR